MIDPVIVFGYDGSTDAQRAVVVASTLMSGPALVGHVWEPMPAVPATAVASPGLTETGIRELANAEREIQDDARAVAEDGARRAREVGFAPEPIVIRGRGGGAWRELLDVAEQRSGTVIVVGRRGVSPLRSALLGSVSDGAVKHADVPVLVVPPPSAT